MDQQSTRMVLPFLQQGKPVDCCLFHHSMRTRELNHYKIAELGRVKQ